MKLSNKVIPDFCYYSMHLSLLLVSHKVWQGQQNRVPTQNHSNRTVGYVIAWTQSLLKITCSSVTEA